MIIIIIYDRIYDMQIQHVLEPWHLLFNRSTTFKTPHSYASLWRLAAGYIASICLHLYLLFLTVCTGIESTVCSCLTWHLWDIHEGSVRLCMPETFSNINCYYFGCFVYIFIYLIICIHSVSPYLYSLICSIPIFICSYTDCYMCINCTIYSCSNHPTNIEWPG